MDVRVDKQGPTHARISLQVPSAELEGEVQRALRRVGRNARMKGFRPGKVPVQVLEKSFGAEVRRETVQDFVRKGLQKAIEDEELEPAAHPRISQDDLQVLVGQDLELEFDLYLRPEIELSDLRGLEVTAPKVEVTDEEVEAAIADVERRQARPEPAGEEGLPADGMAVAQVQLLHGDEVVEEREGMRLSPGTPPPGADPEAFRDALTGLAEGETAEVPITFPDDFPQEELRGAEGSCRVTLANAFRMVPPERSELLATFGAEDEEKLREVVRERMLEAKREQRDQAVETRLLEQVIQTHPLEVPSALVEEQVRARLDRMARELAEQGVEEAEARTQVEAEEDAAYEASRRGLAALYLVEAIGRKEGLRTTDQDMMTELQAIARRNGVSVDEVKEYYSQNDLFGQLATELLEKKVRRFLRENANVTEE